MQLSVWVTKSMSHRYLAKRTGLCAADVDNPDALQAARQAIGLTEDETTNLDAPFAQGWRFVLSLPKGHHLARKIQKPPFGVLNCWAKNICVCYQPSIHP
jgi:hypothetical protein